MNARSVALLNTFFALLLSSCVAIPEPTEEVILNANPTVPSYSTQLLPRKIPSSTNTVPRFPTMTTAPSQKATSFIGSPTPTVDVAEYSDIWVVYVNESLGFQFEYPKLYDFPAKVTYGDYYVDCAPEVDVIGNFHVGLD